MRQLFCYVVLIAAVISQGPNPTPMTPAPASNDLGGQVVYLDGSSAGVRVHFAQDGNGDIVGTIEVGDANGLGDKVVTFTTDPIAKAAGTYFVVNVCGLRLRAALANGPGEMWSAGVRDMRTSGNVGSTNFPGGSLEGPPSGS